MPRVSPIQEAFTSGEISRRVRGRVSTDAYKKGLKKALNWYPLVQGPMRLREGSAYLTSVAGISAAATGTLTAVGQPANNDTVTINGKVYTFQATLTDVDGNVLIGATASDSLDNLIAAINLGAGSGTTYAASTTLHPTVSATAGAGDTMDATAKEAGTAGNNIATTDASVNLSWGAATLTGGSAANWTPGQVGSSGIRTFTFQRGINEDVVLEVGDGKVVARDSVTGESLSGGVTNNLIPDPEYSDGFPSSEWSPDRDKYIFNTDPGRVAIIDRDGPLLPGTPSAFVRYRSNTNNTPDGFHGIAHENASAVPIIIPAGSETELNELVVRWKTIFTATQIAALGGSFPLPDPVIRVSIGTTKGAADVFTSDIAIGQNLAWVDTTFNFIPGVGNNSLYLSIGLFWTGTIDPVPDLRIDEADPDQKYLLFHIGVLKWTAPLAGGSGGGVEFASPWTREQLECLQYDMDPGEQAAFFTHPEVEPHRLRLAVGEWTFEPLTAITTPNAYAAPTPNNWAAGNWPGACVFHEGRLWLGGSPNNPATLWGSRSGVYVDFNNTAPASKDDPVLFPLSSAGNIKTLTSRNVLVINTDISEVVGYADVGPIAFDDFSFPKQTDWGSNCVQPIVIGNDMIFTSASRKIMRTFADQSSTNVKWDGTELSLLAQDLFNSPVRQMEFIDEPTYQAAFLMADGTLAMATYFYPENVIGWWKYKTAYNGSPDQPTNQVMSITTVNTSQGAKLWITVNRVGFSGTSLPGHEIIGFDQGGKVALDSHSVRNVSAINGTCNDLDHLTGQTVSVVVERFDPDSETFSYTVHPDVVVAAGSTPPLADWAWGETAYIGHAYENEYQLLSVEGVSNRGTSQSSKRHWNKIVLRLNNSAIPLVDGQRAKDRTPSSPMGEGEPFTSNDIEFTDLGSGEGDLSITQDKPLMSEVVAIFGKIASREV